MPEMLNPDELHKMFSLPTQDEVNYSPAGGTTDHACSNCRFFLRDGWDGQPRCHLIENWPEPIEPNGVCSRHETKTETLDLGTPIAVVLVEPPINIEYDSAEMALSVPKPIAQRVLEFAKSLVQFAPRATPEPPAFKVFKTQNGKMGWIARHTGKWIDREKEILADKAHDRYLARVAKGEVPLPELWMWHNSGTKHGQAIAVWKSGGFVLAAGLIDDTAEGKRMFDYYQKHSGEIKLSHMFHYPVDAKIDGVYYDYTYTKEITTLPDGAEAFPYTSFEEIQTMALPKQAEDMILEAGGQEMLDRARQADSKALTDSKILDGQGVASKGLDAYDQAQIAAAAKMTDLETRLKTAEEALKQFADVPATISAMNESIKRLTGEVETSRAAENKALEQVNDLTKRLAEQTELAAPASQSKDTLLNERDSAIMKAMMEAAKSEDTLSLVEKMVGSKPTVS